MKISWNWLNELIDLHDKSTDEISEILTQTGLEIGGVEEFVPIKGGLEGLVVGKVLKCEAHPNSDHLHLTEVSLGNGTILPIVCGAPNVAKGQKVIVATVGTTLYSDEGEFKIKKSKIRGEVSEGMICAEDEIGVGNDHDGIMVLPDDIAEGTPAKEYFNLKKDIVFEVDLTPNRIDGASHYGVARDLAAYFNQFDYNHIKLEKRPVQFSVDNHDLPVSIKIERPEACKRYSGVSIKNITVAESPKWLQDYLKAVGQTPINNIVDITNFVLLETGQPLHAFDADQITGNEVIVKTLPKDTPFTTLDGKERRLHEDDLMICNANAPMCMAGVLGGLESGITDTTKSVFLESACFDSVFIRKTARRHDIHTEASFRFERGTDPNNTIYPLQLAVSLIKELAGGETAMDILDIYPQKIEPATVELDLSRLDALIGQSIDRFRIKDILEGLEIKIIAEKEKSWLLSIPTYRVDVTREADVIEEILRIYGYNNIAIPQQVRSSITYSQKPDKEQIINLTADLLTNNGFFEIMNNSLTAEAYYQNLKTYPAENLVTLKNPLSNELNAMRQTLLFGFLESIRTNFNRQKRQIKFYEFGNVYSFNGTNRNELKNYTERFHFAVALSGIYHENAWQHKPAQHDFFSLKSTVDLVLQRFSIEPTEKTTLQNDIFEFALEYKLNNKPLVQFGKITNTLQSAFDIERPIFFGEFNWDFFLELLKSHHIRFSELPKFPEVQRDLALLIDKSVSFYDIEKVIRKTDKKLIKDLFLFDIFDDETKLGKGKLSYAIRLSLLDRNKTLKDKEVNKLMDKIVKALKEELNATLR